MIPVGVNALGNQAQVTILSVSGLPGQVNVVPVTSTTNLGVRAAVNVAWTPTTPGQYTAQVTAQDKVSGNIITADFLIVVQAGNGGSLLNTSAIIAPLGVQQVQPGGTVTIPVSASRPNAISTSGNQPTPYLMLNINGLPTATLTNLNGSTTSVSGVVTWNAPTVPGTYFLNIDVNDAYGANTTEQVPVIVGTSSIPPMIFDQLSTQFTDVNWPTTIPIGVTAFGNKGQVTILSVSGLPGLVNVVPVTSTTNLGPRAAINLSYTINIPGQYTAQVTAQDLVSGNIVTGEFLVVVQPGNGGSLFNTSATIAPIGVQQVAPGGTLTIPVSASRPNAIANSSTTDPTPPYLMLNINGLPTATLTNLNGSITNVSGVVRWTAPTTPGVYMLDIVVSDAYGANTIVEVPVVVS
jgi:hypothetical protein